MDNGNDGSAVAPSLPEAAAAGLTWDTRGPDPELRPDHGEAELMHGGDHIASVWLNWGADISHDGCVPSVDTFGKERGDLKDHYLTLTEAMSAAESWAVDRGLAQHLQDRDTRSFLDSQVAPTQFFQTPKVEQYAEASESFYSRLNDIAARRGAEMKRGDFDMGR